MVDKFGFLEMLIVNMGERKGSVWFYSIVWEMVNLLFCKICCNNIEGRY